MCGPEMTEGQGSRSSFDQFCNLIRHVYSIVEPNKSGANATYIPLLAEVDPEYFAVSVTTIDGRQFSLGHDDVAFSIQSCSKPISYIMAMEQFGTEYVHHHVGYEPSGLPFNEPVLKDAPTQAQPTRQIPHNPMVSAGAIMVTSMVHPELSASERLAEVIETWKAGAGGPDAQIGYSQEIYESESAAADRNRFLGSLMQSRHAFPDVCEDHAESLELYFQCCSITSTNKAMSVMAATLANSGICPKTRQRVFKPENVRQCSTLMTTCGMYDSSGQWAFEVGVPAKSGVGGCVMMVIPNVCGISVFSPRLDPNGNSVRGAAVGKELVKYMSFNTMDVLYQSSKLGVSPALATRRRLRRGSAPPQLIEPDLLPLRKTSWDAYEAQPADGANGMPSRKSDATPMAEVRRRARSAEDRARAAEERARLAEERALQAEKRAEERDVNRSMLSWTRRWKAAAAKTLAGAETVVRKASKEVVRRIPSKEGMAVLRRKRSKVQPGDVQEVQVRPMTVATDRFACDDASSSAKPCSLEPSHACSWSPGEFEEQKILAGGGRTC